MKPGDTVRFLNTTGGGKVARIDGRTAYVIDPEDGFETPVLISECVVVPAGPAATASAPDTAPAPAPEPLPAPMPTPAETPYGNEVTAALIFEPHDIKRLSSTAFDLYLVNDSNYTLQYVISSRDRLDSRWTLLDAGEIGPNVQAFVREVGQTELNSLENISVQFMAYKSDKPYDIKAPIGIETRFDVTRLAKLHCFTPTAYSTTPVVTIPLATKDRPHSPLRMEALLRSADDTPPEPVAPRPRRNRNSPARSADEPVVVDLHINQLLDSTAGLQNSEILDYQLQVFDREMKAAAGTPGRKIIFIHGKGEGILRHAVLERLRRFWPKCQVQDASFREYGFGATQVTIR